MSTAGIDSLLLCGGWPVCALPSGLEDMTSSDKEVCARRGQRRGRTRQSP